MDCCREAPLCRTIHVNGTDVPDEQHNPGIKTKVKADHRGHGVEGQVGAGYSHRNQRWVWRWAWTRIPHLTCTVQSGPPHLRQVSMFEQVCFVRLEGNQLSPGVSDPSPHWGWMNSCPSRIVLHAVGPEKNIRGAVTHISTSAGWIMKKCLPMTLADGETSRSSRVAHCDSRLDFCLRHPMRFIDGRRLTSNLVKP